MQKTNIPQTESQSADLIQNNIEQLKQLFPEVVKEGRVDFNALNDLLGNYADTAEERFCLNWAGKANARREAQKRSTGTLRPCPEESVDWDTTDNLYIEGDNLEVLKLLQKSYHSRIKMIYIDPPYNTGKDFVYKDNYTDNMKNYLELTGQDKKLSTNTESDGRYHSNWLNMMYPRLKLARNLLTDDGVIFISIDDNEVANLRKLCDDIYGESNFLATFARRTKNGGGSAALHFAIEHDYVIVYAKNGSLASDFYIPHNQEYIKRYSEEDECGKYFWDTMERSYTATTPYEIKAPDGTMLKGKWFRSQERFLSDLEVGEVRFIKKNDDKWSVQFKQRIADGKKMRSLMQEKEFASNPRDLNELELGNVFSFPKPLYLVKLLIQSIVSTDSLILDFFSGSATTAHAVMQLNAEDGGNRKYICVQLPEATPEESEARKAGYSTIPEIAKERIRRAGKKIVEEQKAKTEKEGSLFATETKKLDIGFKVFKLDSSNIKTWDSNPDNLETTLPASLFNIKTERSEEDLLYEILIKYGIELTEKVNSHTIDGKTVYEMGAGSLIVCLADNLSASVAEGIGKLYKEVSPNNDENNKDKCRVVFSEAGFGGSDEMKTNTLLILKQHGITNVATV